LKSLNLYKVIEQTAVIPLLIAENM